MDSLLESPSPGAKCKEIDRRSALVPKTLEFLIELEALRSHVFLQPLQSSLELAIPMPDAGQRRMRLGPHFSLQLVVRVLRVVSSRTRVLRQHEREDHIRNRNQRTAKEQRSDHHQHPHDDDVESEVV